MALPTAPKNPLLSFLQGSGGDMLADLGYGLSRGNDWQSGLSQATQRTAEMDPYRTEERERKAGIAEAQAQKNQTADWLRQQGRNDLADAIDMGSLTGSDAWKQHYADTHQTPKTPEAFTLGPGQVRFDGAGNQIASGGADPGAEGALYDDYYKSPAVKTYDVIKGGYQKVVSSAQLDSGPGDMSLIFGYMKMLDPTSVVREGEFATAENSGGIAPMIANLYNRALSGERLTPDQRQQFITAAESIYRDASSDLTTFNDQFSTRVNGQGVDPTRIILQPEVFQAPGSAVTLPSGNTYRVVGQ